MKNLRKIIALSTIFVMCYTVGAQEKVIHGIVTTLGNVPLTGVAVEVKSTSQVVLTDTLGRFHVACNYDDKLTVSAEGFYKRKVKINKPVKFAAVNLTMMPVKRGHAYSIGYNNHVLEDEKITAVDNLDNDDANFTVYNNIYELISGRIPGVQIVNGEVIIRGVNSINASSAATIIIDGTTVDESVLRTVSPSDVKNISVIKDASAAVYGFQGSNGVLIIETKSARNQD